MSEWTDFFSAQVGASSALLGLLFVSLSLNLTTILANGGLTERIQQALLQLLVVLVVSLLQLMPGQSLLVAGLEVLAISAFAVIVGTLLAVRGLRLGKATRPMTALNLTMIEFALLPWLIGGVMMLAGNPNGGYWLAVGMCLSIIKAVADAWIFLVEINR